MNNTRYIYIYRVPDRQLNISFVSLHTCTFLYIIIYAIKYSCTYIINIDVDKIWKYIFLISLPYFLFDTKSVETRDNYNAITFSKKKFENFIIRCGTYVYTIEYIIIYMVHIDIIIRHPCITDVIILYKL
jgi:hypothetical protein